MIMMDITHCSRTRGSLLRRARFEAPPASNRSTSMVAQDLESYRLCSILTTQASISNDQDEATHWAITEKGVAAHDFFTVFSRSTQRAYPYIRPGQGATFHANFTLLVAPATLHIRTLEAKLLAAWDAVQSHPACGHPVPARAFQAPKGPQGKLHHDTSRHLHELSRTHGAPEESSRPRTFHPSPGRIWESKGWL